MNDNEKRYNKLVDNGVPSESAAILCLVEAVDRLSLSMRSMGIIAENLENVPLAISEVAKVVERTTRA